MSDVVVADSSCLIALSKIGHLEILRKLFGNVEIPDSVYREVVIQGAGRLGADEVAQAEWITSHEVQDRLAVRTLKLTLGDGESEAIVLASERQAKFLVLDDWKARQMALGLSLPVIGTVAVLGKAVEKGFFERFAISVGSASRSWLPVSHAVMEEKTMPGPPVTIGCNVMLSPGAAGPPDTGVIVAITQVIATAGGMPLATGGSICQLVNSVTGVPYSLPIGSAGVSTSVKINGQGLVRVGDKIPSGPGVMTIIGPPAAPYINDQGAP